MESLMQIQVNTDRNIEGHEELIQEATGSIEHSLARVADEITHVTIRLRDENSDKKGGIDDIRCTIDADLKGRRPIAVADAAATWEQALSGASSKLLGVIDTTLGRQRHQDRHRTDPPPPGAVSPDEPSAD